MPEKDYKKKYNKYKFLYEMEMFKRKGGTSNYSSKFQEGLSNARSNIGSRLTRTSSAMNRGRDVARTNVINASRLATDPEYFDLMVYKSIEKMYTNPRILGILTPYGNAILNKYQQIPQVSQVSNAPTY